MSKDSQRIVENYFYLSFDQRTQPMYELETCYGHQNCEGF